MYYFIFTAPLDYKAITIVIPPASNTNSIVSVFITINDDEVVEHNEYFFVRIEVIDKLANCVQLVQSEAEIIILNEDSKMFTIFVAIPIPYTHCSRPR